MVGYFASTQYFGDMTDINLKDMIFKKKMKEIDDDLVPFVIFASLQIDTTLSEYLTTSLFLL